MTSNPVTSKTILNSKENIGLKLFKKPKKLRFKPTKPKISETAPIKKRRNPIRVTYPLFIE